MTSSLTPAQRANRARNAARRLGLSVSKIPANGTYAIVDPSAPPHAVVITGATYGLTLDDLEHELRERGAFNAIVREARK
ncbi:MAG: hypothetical protein JWL79_140 [Frankiales bacterium]|nr:hypothetical protein [Frankiales bacterium]